LFVAQVFAIVETSRAVCFFAVVEDDSTLMTPPTTASSGPDDRNNLFLFPSDVKTGANRSGVTSPQNKPFYCEEGAR